MFLFQTSKRPFFIYLSARRRQKATVCTVVTYRVFLLLTLSTSAITIDLRISERRQRLCCCFRNGKNVITCVYSLHSYVPLPTAPIIVEFPVVDVTFSSSEGHVSSRDPVVSLPGFTISVMAMDRHTRMVYAQKSEKNVMITQIHLCEIPEPAKQCKNACVNVMRLRN